MTHLDDLLNYWDHLSKGETPTTKQVREARDKDDRPCTFNPDFSCGVMMKDGSGHCCRDYDQYEGEKEKLNGIQESSKSETGS